LNEKLLPLPEITRVLIARWLRGGGHQL